MTLEVEKTSESPLNPSVPRHVAIIMDGNGRWAARRGLSRLAGHRAGTENIRGTLKAMYAGGIKYVTLFAFSTENWGRPGEEVAGLLELLQNVLDSEVPALHEENVRIRHLGLTERLPIGLGEAIAGAVELTEHNTGLNLCVAFDYGGRAEIVNAVRGLIEAGVPADEIDEAAISANLYLPDVPEPDLIVRTAGEMRLSNFLIWQASYAEYYQTAACWPDFDATEVEAALAEYSRRKRRFGLLPSATSAANEA
jgi:undecaprenyl diphosphate synthase